MLFVNLQWQWQLISKRANSGARSLAHYAFCIESRKSWFEEILPLLKNTLQSEILQVNKISISFFKNNNNNNNNNK